MGRSALVASGDADTLEGCIASVLKEMKKRNPLLGT
jgi:hypothetical protein